MNQEFVTYEQALAIKELGFNEPCFGYYRDEYNGINNPITYPKYTTQYDINTDNTNFENALMLAPLKQQVFKWFRDNHRLHSTITSISQESWQWHITKPGESLDTLYAEDFYTHEEAESACIDNLIELIKT